MADAMVSSKCGMKGAMRGLSATLCVAIVGASLGSANLAFAQGKPASTAAPPATAVAKPPAATATAAATTTATGKPAVGGAAAAAPPDKKKAGEHFKKGKAAFDKKDYKAAHDEFKAADDMIPAGLAEYYLGRCDEELGNAGDASGWYDKALATGKLNDDQSKDAKTRNDALKAKPAKVSITSDPPGASIMVDGAAVPDKTPASIDVAPGTHKITIQLTGKKSVDKSVDVAAFTGGMVDAGKLEDAAPPPPAEDPFATKPPPATTTTVATTSTTKSTTKDSGPRDNTWVIVTGIGAVAGLAVGTIFGLKALSDHSKYNDTPTRDLRDTGTRDALIADTGFGIGVTLAITSAVLYFSGPSDAASAEAKPRTISFAPVIGGGGSASKPSMAGAVAAFAF